MADPTPMEQNEDHELLFVDEQGTATPVARNNSAYFGDVLPDSSAAASGDPTQEEVMYEAFEEHASGDVAATAGGLKQKHRRRSMTNSHHTPHSVTARSASSHADHLWLVHHQASTSAHIKAFDTVEALAAKAHMLVNTVPMREQIEALQRGEPAPAAMAGSHQAAAWQQLEPLRPINVRRAVMRRRGSHGSSSSSSSSSDDSSSDSSSSSDSDKEGAITQAFWVDLQTRDPAKVEKVMRLFPIHEMTVQRVLGQSDEGSEFDHVEVFTSLNYVFSSIMCKPLLGGDSTATANVHGSEVDEVTLAIVAFEDWIVTIHSAPIVGMTEVLKRIQAHFNSKRRMSSLANNTLESSLLAGLHQTFVMTPAWLMSTLIDFVVESFLPDPTKVLAEVDSVDEMVLLIAPDLHNDQSDLLRRIAILRRRISSQRGYLFRKEQLVQQLLMPSMRSTFVSSSSSVAERYKHTLAQIAHVAERLDAARDILNQANSNFVSGVSMSMSQASTRMNLKMQLLSQVATICLPLNLVAGIFGMNVNVPYAQADGYTDLTPFYIIVGCMVLWLVVLSPPLVKTFIKMRRETVRRKTGPASKDNTFS